MEVSARDLAAARDEFRHLLASETQESDWQKFFSLHPYVFSRSLPVRIEPTDVIPLGRPGKTEPDFIFYPRNISPVPYYGVIEIKKPSSKIVTITRTNVAVLTTDANTAIQQVTAYSNQIGSYAPILSDEVPVCLGNRAFLFVVMGLSRELSEKLSNDVYQKTIATQVPLNTGLLTYDELLGRYESGLPQRLFVLIPDSSAVVERQLGVLSQPKLYVGGLSYSTTDGGLRDAFSQAGTVVSVAVIIDSMTNRSKGFGFVEMASPRDAQIAIEMWNGHELDDRRLTVNEARPMEPRAPRTGDFLRRRDGAGRTW